LIEFAVRQCYRGKLRAAIFDWAGTTVDYGSRAPAMAFVELFRRRGIPITMEQARGPMGLDKRDHVREIAQGLPGRTFSDADIEALYREFVPLQIEILPGYAELIPGTIETVAGLRRRGMKIGTTTGYSREMMQVLEKEARRRGFEPDVTIAADEAPAGRPAPWMALRAAMELGVYPMEACVKIGDTRADIAEGLNAGMWTVGVAKTGNEMGLSQQEVAGLDAAALVRRLAAATGRLAEAGAHFVVESVAELPEVVERIDRRLEAGERP